MLQPVAKGHEPAVATSFRFHSCLTVTLHLVKTLRLCEFLFQSTVPVRRRDVLSASASDRERSPPKLFPPEPRAPPSWLDRLRPWPSPCTIKDVCQFPHQRRASLFQHRA